MKSERLSVVDDDCGDETVVLKILRNKRARVVLPEDEGPERPSRMVVVAPSPMLSEFPADVGLEVASIVAARSI